jgi:HSP20 family protein
MAQDPNITPRGEGTREAGSRGEETRGEVERQRNLETGREGGRQSAVTRRGQLFGTTSSPFHLMRRMAEDIERLFDSDFGRVGFGMSPRLTSSPWRSEGRFADALWAPQVETFRRDNNLVVRADLPGLNKDNVNIEVEDDLLLISGERNDENKDERDDYYRSERTYGRFFRAIQLPEGVDADKIEATFKDGVLEVTVPAPKVQTPRNRQVKIR